MIRYGVIGTGWITRSLINGAAACPELKLTAVYSRTIERGTSFAADYGSPQVYTDLEAMAASDDLDMVYIASPNVCHMEQSRLFLEHGKHVLCEKPLSADPDEVEALQHLAAKKGRLFREAIMLLYQPQLAILKEAIDAIGTISVAHFKFCQLSSKYEDYCRGEIPNIFNPALHTGTLMDLGVYCVYPALLLFGQPQEVTATASFLTTGADGAGTALLQYPDKQITLSYSKIGQGAAPSEIVGDRGTVTVEHIAKMENVRLHMYGEQPRLLYGADKKETLMGREIAAFARAIQGEDTLSDTADHLALEVSRLMQCIRQKAGIHFPDEIK